MTQKISTMLSLIFLLSANMTNTMERRHLDDTVDAAGDKLLGACVDIEKECKAAASTDTKEEKQEINPVPSEMTSLSASSCSTSSSDSYTFDDIESNIVMNGFIKANKHIELDS